MVSEMIDGLEKLLTAKLNGTSDVAKRIKGLCEPSSTGIIPFEVEFTSRCGWASWRNCSRSSLLLNIIVLSPNCAALSRNQRTQWGNKRRITYDGENLESNWYWNLRLAGLGSTCFVRLETPELQPPGRTKSHVTIRVAFPFHLLQVISFPQLTTAGNISNPIHVAYREYKAREGRFCHANMAPSISLVQTIIGFRTFFCFLHSAHLFDFLPPFRGGVDIWMVWGDAPGNQDSGYDGSGHRGSDRGKECWRCWGCGW